MTDRVPGAPGQYQGLITAEEFTKLQNGEPFAITMKRDDQPITEGTPYSKAAVLPDALAQELCPTVEDPTPADALAALNASLAGKAPAGYGLGETVGKNVTSLSQIQTSGFYRIASSEMPNGNAWWGHATMNGTDCGTLIAYSLGGYSILVEKYAGVWQPIAWFNPPMVAGVEYRTTECWNGNPVYTALISYGKGPSSGACNINLSTVIGLRVIYVEINCKGVNANGWGKFLNQHMGYNEGATGSGNISLSGAGDLSDQDIYLTVKYCKA